MCWVGSEQRQKVAVAWWNLGWASVFLPEGDSCDSSRAASHVHGPRGAEKELQL